MIADMVSIILIKIVTIQSDDAWCTAIEIDADLPINEKHVTLGIKNWASNTYKNKKVTLPYTIKKERLWSVIKVAFDKPVSKDARVNAICKY